MERKEFKQIIRRVAERYGFKYVNRNIQFENEAYVVVIDTQKSNFDDFYYINYGFWVKAIDSDTSNIKSWLCHYRSRFVDNETKGEYYYRDLDPFKFDICIADIIEKEILPIIEVGFEVYLKKNPQDVCFAKKKLKDYLSLEY